VAIDRVSTVFGSMINGGFASPGETVKRGTSKSSITTEELNQ